MERFSFTPQPQTITRCIDCPYCTKATTFGNDGRDGSVVYICSKGAFGKMPGPSSYYHGYADDGFSFSEVSKGIVPLCPMVQAPLKSKVAYELGITSDKLDSILEKYGCEIYPKR